MLCDYNLTSCKDTLFCENRQHYLNLCRLDLSVWQKSTGLFLSFSASRNYGMVSVLFDDARYPPYSMLCAIGATIALYDPSSGPHRPLIER